MRPSKPPGSVTARTTSTAMMPNRQIIITFVMRSTPFCNPRLHTRKPSTMTTSIQPTNSVGFASMSLNTAPTPALSRPLNAPVPIFTTNDSIQPPTVV